MGNRVLAALPIQRLIDGLVLVQNDSIVLSLFIFRFLEHVPEIASDRHFRKIIENESLEIRLSLKIPLQSKSVRNSSSSA